MADRISKMHRSQNMRAIRSGNTGPEMIVRRLVYALGYRYRLHARDLPGKPDLVFRPRRKAIFVHGCFWHGHDKQDCADARRPKSRQHYWNPKLDRNRERDAENVRALQQLGWKVLIIWDCETKDTVRLRQRIFTHLGSVV